MPLKPIQRWGVLRQRLTTAAKQKTEADRVLEDVEVECEEFVQGLIDGSLDGVARWESGMHRIAGILVGSNAEFEIDDLVERVRALAVPPSSTPPEKKT